MFTKKLLYSMIMLLFLCSCSNKSSNEIKQNDANVPTFVDLRVSKQLENGWVQDLYIEIPKKQQNSEKIKDNFDIENIEGVFFDIVNLKYQHIDGFYTPMIDNNGKEIGKIDTVMPSYIQSSKYGKATSKIGEFFTEKKFTHKITVEDLKELSDIPVKKEDLVYLYNEAIEKIPASDYSFPHIKDSNLMMKQLNNGDKLQFSYISGYMDIGICNLEYIYKNGTYLSDLVKEQNASKDQIALQERIEKIEDNLLKTQDIDKINSLGSEDYDVALKELLNVSLGNQTMPNE